MPFTKFTNLDFDQIKTSIKDYIRANSTFTDMDFEGSNFSVLIDTLAYNTYITAFNSNMIVNESFLDSATLRENVVSLARQIGYVPKSKTAARAKITFTVTLPESSNIPNVLYLKAGVVCTGITNESSLSFSIPADIQAPVVNGVATFSDVEVYQGSFLNRKFTYDSSIEQNFILDNSNIDTSTLNVFVAENNETGLGVKYTTSDGIFNVDKNTRMYLLQEIQDEKYQLLFGDGLIGKKLETGYVITANYIITDGIDGNGARNFSFSGIITDINGNIVQNITVSSINTLQAASGGGDIESINSIKYYAPRIYSSQQRAVTARDYEAIIKKIYPLTESVSVVGGEELDPPEYGNVIISIKPKNGTFVSNFDKSNILNELKQYSISGINQKIIDLKVLYVEIDSSIYFDYGRVSNVSSLNSKVVNILETYSKSTDLNKFGGRFKYSKLLQIIDNSSNAITSNITKVKIRRDLKALLNQYTQYELCYGNKFYVKSEGFNIKSTGFKILGSNDTCFITDIPNADKKTGILSVVKPFSAGKYTVMIKSAGTVDYEKGEIMLGTLNITSTVVKDNIIEIEAIPDSNDVVGLKDLYLTLDISNSQINMVKDVIASGEDISGVSFTRDYYTSSYSNGSLERK